MKKSVKNVLENIKKYNGLCHIGTISQDTGYTFPTIKRALKELVTGDMIENIPSDGKECWYITNEYTKEISNIIK